MYLNLNVFSHPHEFEMLAFMFDLIRESGRKITFVLANWETVPGQNTFAFRVFAGPLQDISFKTDGRPSSGMSAAPCLIEVRGETNAQLVEVCAPFLKGLQLSKHKDSTVWCS